MDILQRIKNKFDQVEFLNKETKELKIRVENWDLEGITQKNLSSSSLRVIKNGKFGSNYTLGNSEDTIDKLIEGAEESAYYGSEANIKFSTDKINEVKDESRKNYENIDAKRLFSFIEEILTYTYKKNKDITFNLYLNKSLDNIYIKTSEGGNLKENMSNFQLTFGAPVPGGGTEITRSYVKDSMFDKSFAKDIDEFIDEYEKAKDISIPKTGSMPVLFSPQSLYFIFVSLQEGISGKKIYQQTSPLIDRKGDKIFSEKFAIVDDPHMKNSNYSRYFDDEGILTKKRTIIENGILKNYIYDLEYANKLDVQPTGNGLKRQLFREDISTSVFPSLINPVIQPGSENKKSLIASLDEGIYATNIIGFHSSNYEQGQFSVQAQGFHVKNGQLIGRLQDVMMAGNIYDDFQNIIGIGNKVYPTMWGFSPYMLVDNISVTGQ